MKQTQQNKCKKKKNKKKQQQKTPTIIDVSVQIHDKNLGFWKHKTSYIIHRKQTDVFEHGICFTDFSHEDKKRWKT